ncbi:hypothetical protein [Pontibacter oryzae]|uniref:Uncharacterized protein n=1 Tax=Pontibacter oryzae TaxID=2304593 RepID=A0A399SLA0_9BACT|nr:hypothetical protein [Pontibacter oryzae]RIJ43002.1 hypothetical protein D1627_03975 [Pontibacter oryzae]
MSEFMAMQEEQGVAVPEEKLFNLSAIMLATFLGGPIAGGYLIYSNYVMLGAPERGKQVIFYAVLIMYGLIGSMLFLPDATVDKLPNFLIPWVSAAVAYFIAKNLQGELLTEHAEAGGQFYTRWRAVWVSLVCVLVTILLLVPLVLFL